MTSNTGTSGFQGRRSPGTSEASVVPGVVPVRQQFLTLVPTGLAPAAPIVSALAAPVWVVTVVRSGSSWWGGSGLRSWLGVLEGQPELDAPSLTTAAAVGLGLALLANVLVHVEAARRTVR